MKKLLFLIAAIGFSIFAYGAYIPAKAVLAQYLINDAWNDSLRTGEIHKPWEWADMHPVMKLSSSKHDQSFIVLSGDKGNSLAFAPGYNINSFMPHQGGTTVISAHRDTHFRFLEEVVMSDIFELTDESNRTASYVVTEIKIIDSTKQDISIHSDQDELKLVTCFPFDGIVAGGPLRYVVTAKLI